MEPKTLEDTQRYLQETTEDLLAMREIDNLEMYRTLTDLGNDLTGVSEDERTDQNFVYGCVSNVYIAADVENGRMIYRGVSESHVVRGYLAVLCTALTGLTPDDVVHGTREAVERFARDTDIKSTLTPNRANAFGNIYQLMVEKAKAVQDGA